MITENQLASDDIEVTYFNPNAVNWNRHIPKSERKQKHRKNVPSSKRFDYDISYKDLFFTKFAYYKRLSHRRTDPPINRCHIDQDMALWDVTSVHSNDWMSGGDGNQNTPVEEEEPYIDRAFIVPIVTVDGHRRYMILASCELEEFYRNLKMKTCFRMKKLIFNLKSEGIRSLTPWWR